MALAILNKEQVKVWGHIAKQCQSSPLIEAQNEKVFRSKCEEEFGCICTHECTKLAKLFDREDFSTSPPTNEDGGVGYKMTHEDCLKCLKDDECEPPDLVDEDNDQNEDGDNMEEEEDEYV